MSSARTLSAAAGAALSLRPNESALASLAAHLKRPGAGSTAVVVGASLAGLLAARVLADRFDNVVLLDRGDLPDGDANRKATPHTLHAHGLLARGRQVLEDLFPGIRDDWLAQGATVHDMHRHVAFYVGRRRYAQGLAGEPLVALGRAAIEGSVRRRVMALPNVHALGCVSVDALVLARVGRRVGGVSVTPEDDDLRLTLPAQLVVDAAGRASALPRWLGAMGHTPPQEERIAVSMRYATVQLDIDRRHAPREMAVLCAATPDCPRPAMLLRQDGVRWLLTLGGYGNDAPPLDPTAFRARALGAAPEIARAVARAHFISTPQPYHFAYSLRRRYEDLRSLPDGVVVIGDALCSLNPIHGQGMAVAATQAQVLRECLAEGTDQLAQRFFKSATRIVDLAWSAAQRADLVMPGVKGTLTPMARLANAYAARLHRAAQTDPDVALAALEVTHLLAGPGHLLRPGMLWRVLRLKRRPLAARRGEGSPTVTVAVRKRRGPAERG